MSAPTWTEDAESRQDLGISSIAQTNTATFSLSDYTAGGYSILPAAFGLARIRGAEVVGYSGTTRGWLWQLNKASGAQPPSVVMLQAYGGVTAGTEATAGTNFSGGALWVKAEGY